MNGLPDRVDRGAIRFVGTGLQRPASLAAAADGTLWMADARGVVRLSPAGEQSLVYQSASSDPGLGDKPLMLGNSLPVGVALDGRGHLLIANAGIGAIERMAPDGPSRTVLDTLDGRPLGRPAAVLRDSRDRIWFTTTRSPVGGACVGVIDDRGARIVADGLHGAGELRFDAREDWLHVAEPAARRVLRLRIDAAGDCVERAAFGLADLGGVPAGLAFDVAGNLWVALAERLVAITPAGDERVMLDDGDAAVPRLAGIAFGGPGLRTLYLGSLGGTSLASFEAPVAGLPLATRWP